MHTKPGVGVSGVGGRKRAGRGYRYIRAAHRQLFSQIPPGERGRLAAFILGWGEGAGRKLLPSSVGSLTVFKSFAGDLQLHRHLAVHLEMMGEGGLGGACHLPFS